MKWKRKVPVIERVLARIRHDENGCWVWPGAVRNTYGAVGTGDGRKVGYVHRVTYESFVGPIPDGLVIDHLCRNRLCCNPAHLEVVTRFENCARGLGGRGNKPPVEACHRGHQYTPENTYTNPAGYRACRTCKQWRRTNDPRLQMDRAA